MHQTGWVAVAVSPDDGPGASGTALAGAGRGHTLDGQRRQRPGSRPTTREPRAARPPAALGPARGGAAPPPLPLSAWVASCAGVPAFPPAPFPSLVGGCPCPGPPPPPLRGGVMPTR